MSHLLSCFTSGKLRHWDVVIAPVSEPRQRAACLCAAELGLRHLGLHSPLLPRTSADS